MNCSGAFYIQDLHEFLNRNMKRKLAIFLLNLWIMNGDEILRYNQISHFSSIHSQQRLFFDKLTKLTAEKFPCLKKIMRLLNFNKLANLTTQFSFLCCMKS